MFQGFQRIKGAIDQRIAEEQAKQRSSASPSRTPSAPRRSSSRNLSPSKRPGKAKDADNGSKAAPTGKGPDPSTFETDFVIGEDDEPSRAATPRPKEKTDAAAATSPEAKEKPEDGEAAMEDEKNTPPLEIPPEVQTRLRKLDKLEPKYSELLRSYRIAHARVTAIEAFEASLRENTPLTSISEPAAFVEYLGQLNVKSDMLMEELKRVSKERDELNKKFDESERSAKESQEELRKLQEQAKATNDPPKDDSTTQTDPGIDTAIKETETTDDSEEFFSYDNELPRLQSQLQENEEKAAKLEEENKSLKSELSVAQESAESFMKNLETATNDLHSLKDTHAKSLKQAEAQHEQHDSTVADFKNKLQTAERELAQSKEKHSQHDKTIAELKEKVESTSRELEELHATRGEELVENHGQETLRDQVEKLESDLTELRETQAKSVKRNDTLNNLVNSLREQLKTAEAKRDTTLTELERTKKELDTAMNAKETVKIDAPTEPPTSTVKPNETASKKKNRKKKKGGKAADASTEATPSEAGSVNGLLSPRDAEFSPSQLQADLDEVADKESSIESLKGRLETLRHDLLDFGQEHTEAKDKIKELQAEKAALQERMTALEKEIAELHRKTLFAEFEELKAKADTLQIDLSVAEQLAASRFKDLTDMRDILQKAQPELLDELSTKTGELRRLEIYKSQVSEKEGDIRNLNEKTNQRKDVIEHRDRLAKDLTKAQDDLKASRNAARDLEQEVSKLTREAESLRDEIQLNMQDQTQEMGTQMKEELADAHRLLSERSREAETMRRLLADAQGRAEARVREMQERLDVAVEERDRAEEQANTFSRRRARELEDLKQNARDAERALAPETEAAEANEEVAELRLTTSQLRDTLDESERQARDLDKEKADLRRAFDETQTRLEKLQKSSKTMADELKQIQAAKGRALESNVHSSRSSTESSRSRIASPTPKGRAPSGQPGDASGIDYVYLKNVLLQFLEQRDKKYQQQLIPVLGMLLHFDKKDEQKWMAAISAK
ncbi:hypothetical protein K491DRAFT_707665 [Lophiostoma macrostomum CBS 122681]|uniref:GRIP domain-containing protein n=1 Tax=Lophiostoma macrostomum CBS 122681 TaxID=1314788 RepID=A0A6A6STE1_9PLEO|nr:hypothetical protein K491DRAFT_707665 [Lophiostoma macrostomum CBS 122681]